MGRLKIGSGGLSKKAPRSAEAKSITNTIEKIVEVPVYIEKIVEKPVEVEKLVEVVKVEVKEVPVDRIVEKEVKVVEFIDKVVEKPVEIEKIVEKFIDREVRVPYIQFHMPLWAKWCIAISVLELFVIIGLIAAS